MNTKEKKSSAGVPPVGGSSLLVIFAVLCLMVFALLSMSTVQADRRLSDGFAESVKNYYAADLEAEAYFARIRNGELNAEPNMETEDGRQAYSYSGEINDSQTLEASVIINGDEYSVISWQVVSRGEWEADDSITVWSGDDEF